jgi:hypothetical protein
MTAPEKPLPAKVRAAIFGPNVPDHVLRFLVAALLVRRYELGCVLRDGTLAFAGPGERDARPLSAAKGELGKVLLQAVAEYGDEAFFHYLAQAIEWSISPPKPGLRIVAIELLERQRSEDWWTPDPLVDIMSPYEPRLPEIAAALIEEHPGIGKAMRGDNPRPTLWEIECALRYRGFSYYRTQGLRDLARLGTSHTPAKGGRRPRVAAWLRALLPCPEWLHLKGRSTRRTSGPNISRPAQPTIAALPFPQKPWATVFGPDVAWRAIKLVLLALEASGAVKVPDRKTRAAAKQRFESTLLNTVWQGDAPFLRDVALACIFHKTSKFSRPTRVWG